MNNSSTHVGRELLNQARNLTLDELELVSGGAPTAKDPPPVIFLLFQFKLVAVKTV
jgi:hypothetical protein